MRNPTGGTALEFPGSGIAVAGTFATTGLHTAIGGTLYSTSQTSAAGKIYYAAADGLSIRGIAGSSYDLMFYSADAGAIFANPTGTRNVNLGHASGTVALLGSVTQAAGTGSYSVDDNTATAWRVQQGANEYLKVVTTNAAENVAIGNASTNPTYSFLGTGAVTVGNLTASLPVFTNGSKALTSNAITGSGNVVMSTTPTITSATLSGTTAAAAMTFSGNVTPNTLSTSTAVFTDGSKNLVSNLITGSGNVVMSTSPVLVTPTLGAATATSLVASGNVTADSLISSKFYEEGSFTATLTGCTTSPTATAQYVRVGKMVTVRLPTLTGTSNTGAMTITGFPSAIQPASAVSLPVAYVTDNGATVRYTAHAFFLGGSGTLNFSGSGLFTTSGTKGLGLAQSITYILQ
jgi:hypothetical protein